MIEFYTSVMQYGNNICYRGVKDGHRVEGKIPFKPTLFTPTNKQTEYTGLLSGGCMLPRQFDSIRDARDYIKQYEDTVGFEIHGMQQFQYQYITQKFPGKIEWDINEARVSFLDIETKIPEEGGFPDIEKADCEILLISMFDRATKKIVVFSSTEDQESSATGEFDYLCYDNEKEMLKAFISFWEGKYPDVVSGWNVDGFDFPYLCNRINRVLGDEYVRALSPWGVVKSRTIEVRGKEIEIIDIVGVTILDYMDLYKKFSLKSQESYSLGSVCQVDLGENKLEHEGSFRDFYTNEWSKFVRYNAHDSRLVYMLDKKYNFISLCFSIAYLAKCNIRDVMSPVKTWDVFIYSQLTKENVVIPPHSKKLGGTIEGAYVKAPQVGMHGWTVTVDFGGLYPSIMRQWNMSPETIVAEKFDLHYKDFIEETEAFKEATEYARINNLILAANGSMYRKDIVGIIPRILTMTMEGRKIAKKEMLRLEQVFDDTKDASLSPKISTLNGEQSAMKTLNNSVYGGLANVGSRYFNLCMAEGITITGQLSNIHVARGLNGYMNGLVGTENVDYVIYQDTDSSFLSHDALIHKFASGKSDKQVVDLLMKAEPRLQKVMNKSIDEVFGVCGCVTKVMSIKQEKVCSKILMAAKKKYAAKVHNSEGVMYATPEIKVTGLEIVRSSTPMAIRKMLKSTVPVIFDGGESATQEYIKECRSKFDQLKPEEIAFPRGVSDVEKYVEKGWYKKGTPIGSRAAILYNVFTKDMREKYSPISNGDKIRFLYLKMPNPIKEDVIGFPADGKLPPELGLEKYIDIETQFHKTFMSPVEGMLAPIGWNSEQQSDLSEFFG